MPSTLIDAGPLIALFDRDDRYHQPVREFLKDRRTTLITTWAVLTEACHMLDFSVEAQLNLLEWIGRGGLQVYDLHQSSLSRIVTLTRKYRDRPMDLADASLVVASEILGTQEIISIDSDFNIYRREDNRPLRNIFRPVD
jgi:predicted nucleic acid-binding protein